WSNAMAQSGDPCPASHAAVVRRGKGLFAGFGYCCCASARAAPIDQQRFDEAAGPAGGEYGKERDPGAAQPGAVLGRWGRYMDATGSLELYRGAGFYYPELE